MAARVIAEFPAVAGRLDDLIAGLRAALPETRRFDGCRSVEVLLDEERSAVVMVEEWDSHEHYDRYLQWRYESGIPAEVAETIVGGPEGMVIRKCTPVDA